MKTAALALVIMLAGAACGVSDDGALKLSWKVTEGGAASTCEAVGGKTVRVTSKRKSTNNPLVDLFACTDYSATTSGLRPGTYTVSIELLDKDNKLLSQPFNADARVTSGDDTPLGDYEFQFGGPSTLHATWRVLINETAATCSEVGGTSVIIDATPTAGGDTVRDTFNCVDGAGTTGELAPGTYNVHVSLVNQAMSPLSFVDLQVTVAQGESKNIGMVEFLFDFHKARFKTKMGTTGSNCDLIAEEEIRISDMAQQQCLAYPISGTTGGPAASCIHGGCQAESVTQVVEHLGKGNYVIQVLGYKTVGAKSALCYISDIKSFTVGNGDVELGTITATFDTSMDPEHLCN